EAAVARRQAAAQQARQSLASKLPPSLALALGTGSGALSLPLRGSRAAPGSRSAGVEKESVTAATDIAAEGTVAATSADAPPPGETAKDRALRALRTQRQMTETGEGGDHARGAAGAGVHTATSITGRKLPSAARRNMHGAGPPPTPLHAPVAAEPEPAPVGYVPINRQRGTGGNDGGGEVTASASSGFANARSAAVGIAALHAAPQAYKPAAPAGFKPPLPGGFRPPVPSGFKPPNPAGVRPPIPAGFRHLGPAGFRPPVPAGFKVALPGAGSSGASGGAGATLIGNKRSTPEPSPAPSAPSYGSDEEDGYAGSAFHSHCCTTSAAGAAFTIYGGGLLSCAMNRTCQAFSKSPDRTVCTENGASSRLSHLGSHIRRNGSCGGGSYSSTDFGNRFMLNRLDANGVSVSNGSRSDGDADDEASGDEHGNSSDTSGRIRRTSCGKDRGTCTWFIPQFDGADDVMHDDTGGDGPDISMATTAAAPAATAGLALPLIHSDPVVATAAALGALSGLPLGTDGLAVLAGGDGVAAGMPACEPLLVSAVPAVSPEEAQSALAEATAALVQATAALAEATAALAEATSASPVPMSMPCVTEANGMQILADPNAMQQCLPDPSATPFMTAVDGTAVWGVMPFAAPYAPLALDGGTAAFVALGASDPAVACGSVIDANAAGTACANIHIGALGPGSFDPILPPLHQLQALQPMDTSTATTDFISAPAVSLEPFLGDPACAILHTGTAAAAAAVRAGALPDSSMGILPAATAAVAVGGGAVVSSLAADAGAAADMDLIAIAALGDGPELEEAAVLTFEDDDDDVLDASFHAFIQSDDDIGEGDFGCPVVIGLVPAGPAVPGTILPQQQCQQQQQQQQQRQQQHLVQQQLPTVQEHQELHQQQGSAQKEWGFRQQQQPQASVSMDSSRPGCSFEQTHATVGCTEGHVLQQHEREQQRQQRDRSHQRGGQRRLMEPTTEPRTIKLEPMAEDAASRLPPPPPLPRQEHTQTQRGQQQRQRKEEPSFLKQQMQQGRIHDSVSLNLHHFSGLTSKAPPPPPTPWVGEPSSQRARQAGADAKGADVEEGYSGKAGAQSVGGNTAGVVAVARIKISGSHATMASQPPLPPPPLGAMHNLRGNAIVSPSQSLPTLPRPRPPSSLPGPQLRNPAGGLGETPHGGSGSSPTRGRPIRVGLSSNSPCASSGEGASGSTSGTASSESDLDCRSRSRSKSPGMSPFRRRGARGGMPSPRRRSSRSRSRSPPYHLRRRNSRSRGSRSPARGRGSCCGRVPRSPSRSRSRSRSWSPRAGSRRRGSGRSPPPIGAPYRNGGSVGGGGCADAGRRGGRKRRRRQRGGRRRGGQGYAQPSAAVGMLAGAAPPPPPPSAGPGGSGDGGGGGGPSVAGPAARPLPLPPPPPLPSDSRDRCNRGSGGGGGGGGGTVATASAGVGVPQLREGDRRQDKDRDGTRERTDPRDRERERERSEAHEWDHRGGPRGGFGGSVSGSGGGGDRRSQELACTLFVGDLPHGITAAELRGVFAAYSKEVVNARLVSGQLYGFVRFSSPEAATAVLELSRNMGVEAGGHRLTVARAQGSLPDWKKTGPSQQRREYSVSDGYGVLYDLPPIAIAPGPMRMPMRQPPMFGMFGMGSPVPSGHRVTRHVLEYDDL
ncbi:hypothetical protein Vretimale_15809, partial [Volvox reticuliferus]